MAFGGGTYTKYDKFMPGTYINTITIGAPQSSAVRGVSTTGLVLDWGADNELFEITATEFQENAESITGYSYSDDRNMPLRELFCYANRVIGYKLNSAGSQRASNVDVGQAKYTGKAGNDITVSCYKNVNDEDKYDVKTYFGGVLKDTQTIPEGSVDQMQPTLKEATAGSSIPEELQEVTVDFSIDENKITATYSNIPENYVVSARLWLNNSLCAVIPGRIDEIITDNSVTYAFSPEAAANENYKLEARLKKVTEIAAISDRVLETILSDDPEDDPDYEDESDFTTISSSYVTIKSQTFSTAVKKAVSVGADVTALKDNDFVIFKDKGVIEENAGYVFSGGKSGNNVKVGSYSEYLNALESRSFDVLVYDGEDKGVKALFTAYTKRMRDERGKYFQTVLHNYAEADHEGIISVYNKVSQDNSAIKEGALVYWVGGYSSAVDLTNELTSKPYTGELNIDTSTPDIQLELIVKNGNFVFHRVSANEVYTLFDVNTLTTFTADHDERLSENKAIRIIDYVHTLEAFHINRNYIGSVPNTNEGRALIWNRCYEILSQLQQQGAITDFDQDDLTVEAVPNDRHAVKINQSFTITGTIYRVYITTYIVN